MPSAYRFKAIYLVAEGDGELRGVLPLVAKKTPVRGPVLSSLPWLRAGGPLARDEEAEAELLKAACEIADRQGRVLTIDSAYTELNRNVPELVRAPRAPTWIAEIPAGSEAVPGWLKERSKNLQRGVKRSRSRGVTVSLTRSEHDLRTFFSLYLRTMRKHRTLPRPWRQLSEGRRLLGDDVFRLFVARNDGEIVAGGVFHTLGKTMDLLYNASDERALDLRPNHALYSEAIAWAAENGLRWLDFGAAPPDSSLAEFKRQWGGVESPRYFYEYGSRQVEDGQAHGEARVLGGRRQSIDELWDRAPLPLTRLAGAISFRYL